MRDIKFRAWDEKGKRWLHGYSPGGEGCSVYGETMVCGGWLSEVGLEGLNDVTVEQYIGLKDKNGQTQVYEGDIISPEGTVCANIHEGSARPGIDLVIEGMGIGKWRDAEQEAIRQGCFYAQ